MPSGFTQLCAAMSFYPRLGEGLGELRKAKPCRAPPLKDFAFRGARKGKDRMVHQCSPALDVPCNLEKRRIGTHSFQSCLRNVAWWPAGARGKSVSIWRPFWRDFGGAMRLWPRDSTIAWVTRTWVLVNGFNLSYHN